MRTLWAAAFTLGLGTACGPARLSETRRAAIVDSVEQVVHGALDAANHRNAAGFLAAYVEDAVMAYNGVIYSTQDSYRAALDSVWQAVAGVETRPMSPLLFRFSKELVCLFVGKCPRTHLRKCPVIQNLTGNPLV